METNSDHSEKDEVEDIKWIPISEIANYEWAFNHKDRIAKMYERYKQERIVESLRARIGYIGVDNINEIRIDNDLTYVRG